ncbi:MAG: hypothetical protein EP307_08115 [Rhodobacteraceae bacterium]|nr:MAG: hypothetical protein EP307_08115 [Paracoccaceae bacterium]
MDAGLSLSRKGDTLIVNGESFDFAALPEGALLPRGAIASDWFAGDVTRTEGTLRIAILLPIHAAASEAARFPVELRLDRDGVISLPRGAITKTRA